MIPIVACQRRGVTSWIRPHCYFKAGRIRNIASSAGTDVSEMETKGRLTTIRLYRILQRKCQSFAVKEESRSILLQPELQTNDWGRHVIFRPPSPTMVEELFRLFYVMNDDVDDTAASPPSSIDDWYHELVGKSEDNDLPPMTTMTCWTAPEQLQEAVRTAFRSSLITDVQSRGSLNGWAIRAVHLLQEQQLMWDHSSVATTEGVRVTATTRCLGTTSPTVVSSIPPGAIRSILDNKFRFAYRIRVENVSEQSVQLLGRYWHMEELTDDREVDDTKNAVTVDAPATGAVGHLPVLRPGQVFEYMSGTDMVNAKGIMNGHFYMARVPDNTLSAKAGDHVEALNAGDKFEVKVAPLPLEV